MSDSEQEKLARLQEIFTSLLQHHLAGSLENVEESLIRWRSGDIGPFDVHAEVLKHAARTERMAGRIANAGPTGASSVLRDAFDVELVGRDEFIALTGEEPEGVEPAMTHSGAPTLPAKHQFIESLLGTGPVLLHVDARKPEVAVPTHLKQDPKLVLRFGYGLTPAIHDLEVGAEHVAGTLTFGGVPFHCVLPWTAIYAAVSEADQRAMVWHEDVPEAVLAQMMGQQQGGSEARARAVEPEQPAPSKRRASHLKLVD